MSMLLEIPTSPMGAPGSLQGSPARTLLRSRSAAAVGNASPSTGQPTLTSSASSPLGGSRSLHGGLRQQLSPGARSSSESPCKKVLGDSLSGARLPGDVERVVAMIQGGQSLPIQRDAVKALARLTKEGADARDEMMSAGVVKPLIGYLLDTPTGPIELPTFAAVTLGRLASQSELHKREIIEANGVRKLLALTNGGVAPGLQKEAFRALSLMCDDTACQRQIVKTPGGIDAMVNGLRAGKAAVAGVEKYAAQVLAEIAANDAAQCCSICKIGPVPLVLASLKPGAEFDVCARAVEFLMVLGRFEQNQRSIVKAGGVARLINVLNGMESAYVRKLVVDLLALLATHSLNIPAFEKEGGINKFERLLAIDDDEEVRLSATKLVDILSSSKETVV